MKYLTELMKLAQNTKDIEQVSFESWNDGQWLCWIESYDCEHDGTGPTWDKAAQNALTKYKEIHDETNQTNHK